MKIKNCIFTKSDTTVTKAWEISRDKIHSGVDILAMNIYSPFDGVVISKLTSEGNLYTLVLQYNANICVKISNFKSVDVASGDIVKAGDKLGVCNGTAHIEYLDALASDDSVLIPCRVNGLTFYAQNPTSLVLGKINFPISGVTETTIINSATEIDASPIISKEFGD